MRQNNKPQKTVPLVVLALRDFIVFADFLSKNLTPKKTLFRSSKINLI